MKDQEQTQSRQVGGKSRSRSWAKDLGASNLWRNTPRRNQLGGGKKRTGRQFIQSVIHMKPSLRLVLRGAMKCKFYLRICFPFMKRIELSYPCVLQALTIWRRPQVWAISSKTQEYEGGASRIGKRKGSEWKSIVSAKETCAAEH